MVQRRNRCKISQPFWKVSGPRTNRIALIEIVFNARTADQIPYYLLDDIEEDFNTSLLREVLSKGQETNEFRGDFNPEVVSTIIQGAISETMLSPKKELSHEECSLELVKGILKIVK
ncbi:MAG: hypothetical protein ACOX2P_00615 [Bacillota bacterium]